MTFKSNEIEDRGSQIRIAELHAIPVGRKGYVKIKTNMGVVGWGEINNVETKIACVLAGLSLAKTQQKLSIIGRGCSGRTEICAAVG